MELERETLRRLAECFGGRSCCRCGQPAERLIHHRFYCSRHFPRDLFAGWERAPKVYRLRCGTRAAISLP
jgi:hypothetical protein